MKRKAKRRAAPSIEYESHCHECGDYDAFTERDAAERWFGMDHADCENVALYAYRALTIRRRPAA